MTSLNLIAQENLEFPIAAYQMDGNLYVFGLENKPILVMETDSAWIPSIYTAAPIWSPDGRYLAYQSSQNSSSYRPIFISAINNLSLPIFVAEPHFGTNLAFTLDSQNLLYILDGEWEAASNPSGFEHGTWQDAALILEEFALETATTREIATNALPIIHGIDVDGSSGGMYCAIYRLSLTESRFTRLAPLILADTPYGIVTYFNQVLEYERIPQMQIGNTLLIVPAIAHASLSPDFEEIAFTIESQNQLGRLNLSTQELEIYEINYQAAAVSGDSEHYLYYSVQIEGAEMLLQPQIQDYSCSEHINQVAIYQYDVESGIEKLLYTSSAHSIPWISISPDGQTLYFTMIPNGELWGEKMLEEECLVEDCVEYVFPSLYKLNLMSLESELVLEDVLKPVINFGYQAE